MDARKPQHATRYTPLWTGLAAIIALPFAVVIDLRFTGIHIDVNQKVTPSGDVVGSAAEYGTWKITAATGIYQGWKGRGTFAAVLYGYQNAQPYSVEWDGYVTP
jgi:hypothetical protein